MSTWLPDVDTSRSPEPQVIQLVVKMEIRRSKRILLSLVDPLPPRPVKRQPIYRNTIVEALKIKAFINDGPSRITWAKASKELNISDSRIAQLLKIVNKLPADFIEDMQSCGNQEILKVFNGRKLLKISRLKTEKEREKEIELLLAAFQK